MFLRSLFDYFSIVFGLPFDCSDSSDSFDFSDYIMYYDAHTHLNEDTLYPDWQDHLEAFIAGGGKGLINIGVDHTQNQRAISIAQQTQAKGTAQCLVKAAIGVHPGEVAFGKITNESQVDAEIDLLRTLYEKHHEHIVAIGECGIDAHYEHYETTKTLQQKLFHAQCILAGELDLPIVIHTRDQFDDTREVVQHYPDLQFYFHCRGYRPEQVALLARELRNVRIGFCGNITYPKAEIIRQSCLEVTKHDNCHLLLETDAPYLTPQAVRGEKNRPAFVVHTYAYVAELLDIDLDSLKKNVKEHFERLYL